MPGRSNPAPTIVPLRAPDLWEVLCDYLFLAAADRAGWWAALAHSTAPAHRTLAYGCLSTSVCCQSETASRAAVLDRFLADCWTPQQLIQTLEALVEDGLLGRAEGSRIEEAILCCTARSGAWKQVLRREDA